MISAQHLEGIARGVHDETGIAAPVDAFVLAAACGFTCKPGPRWTLDFTTRVIRYPVRPRAERIHFGVAHEVAHGLLREEGESDDDEGDVDYLASCLVLPRAAFRRDLGETAWDLFEMKSRHPNASYQAIAVRMCQVSPASVSVWDGGKIHATYGGGPTALRIASSPTMCSSEQNPCVARSAPGLSSTARSAG